MAKPNQFWKINPEIKDPTAWWQETERVITAEEEKFIGLTTVKRKRGKQTWWWYPTIQEAIKDKKGARKTHLKNCEANKAE